MPKRSTTSSTTNKYLSGVASHRGHTFTFRFLLRSLPVALLLSLAAPAVWADIVFSAKVAGPVANLFAIDDAGDLHRITDNIRWRDLDADISAAGRIAFSSNRESNTDIDLNRHSESFHIYLAGVPLDKIQPLTRGNHSERAPRFSPDGDSIAFVRRNGGRQQLVLSAPDHSERVLFESGEILDFSWAPDGRQLCLAWRDGAQSALRLVDLDSGREETLARGRDDWIAAARWSPDGRYIALIRHPLHGGVRRLMVLDRGSGRERQLSPEAAQVQQPPQWSADSNRLLYAALLDYRYHYDESSHKKVYDGSMQVLQSSLDGETVHLTDGQGLHKSPVFSPNGTRIAFLYADHLDARSLSLRTMKVDGSDLRELYPRVAQHSVLRWR